MRLYAEGRGGGTDLDANGELSHGMILALSEPPERRHAHVPDSTYY